MSFVSQIVARRRERWLFIVAILVIFLAQSQLSGATTGETFGSATLTGVGLFAGCCLFLHIMVSLLAPRADQVLVPCVALLNGLGVIMIERLDVAAAARGSSLVLANNQIKLTIISLVAFTIVLAVIRDHTRLARYSYLLGVLGLFLLVLPVIWIFGRPAEAEEAKIWIKIGSFTLQPGEFAKIVLILFFAKLLNDKRQLFTIAGTKKLGIIFPRWRDVGQIVAVWFVAMGVMALENDFGPVLLLFGTVLVMLYIATGRVSWFIIGGGLIALGAPILYMISPKIQTRVANTLNPLDDFDSAGYQPSQALFAWAEGGLTGTGIGQGHPNLIPVAHSDYILAAFGEEIGLIGVSAILFVFAVMITRGMTIALATEDNYGKLAAAGFAVTLAIQVFVVVAGISSMLPMTGLTTPFISAGGSSLIANYCLVALLLRISAASGDVSLPQPEEEPQLVAGGVR